MGIIDFLKNTFSSKSGEDNTNTFTEIIQDAYQEIKNKQNYFWSFKANENEVFNNRVLTLTNKEKIAFIIHCVHKISKYSTENKNWSSDDIQYSYYNIRTNFLQHLLRTKLEPDEDDVEAVIQAFSTHSLYGNDNNILHWPVSSLVNQVEKKFGNKPLSEKMRKTLEFLRERVETQKNHYAEKQQAKTLGKIEKILFQDKMGEDIIKPTFFPANDGFSEYANETIQNMPEADKLTWFKLMLHSQKGSGGKPSKKFLEEGKTLMQEFGTDKFKKKVTEWFTFLSSMKEKTEEHTYEYGNQPYTYTTTEFLAGPNVDMIKSFVWLCAHFHDKNTLFTIASLGEKAYRKIPGKGPAAAAVGNACIYVLANTKGLDGVGHLSRLKLRIKQSSTQALIEKYIAEAANGRGVSIHEIEDMAVDDHDLENGKKEYDFNGYKAILEIKNVGKVTVDWFKPDGSPQKTEPAIVKQSNAAKLKKLKNTAKQVELGTSTQRDRLDRMFKSNRDIEWAKFIEFYFSHGLMSFITRRLIWNFKKEGKTEAAFFLDDKWVNSNGEEITFIPSDTTSVSLWHPVFSSVDDVRKWRAFMMQHQIVQPLKQAFRELYILTDAEINTVTYSNRMAAHILKQHQFNSLAKIRGWKYALMGAFDNGINNQMASIELPDYSLRAEFWITEINAEDAYNDTGIWLYISTDQVRFVSTVSGQPVELIEVPLIVFSEIMRDVDLFVGVASIGNDPAWQDSGGMPAYRDYWQSYSFGDLSEIAKTRKSILENLLPRLKIANVAELKDKFLVVKGKLRTYKIHIGSTNILMEPNDQYLCIVPDRGQKPLTQNMFLPFEGDTGLSIILSKAMLLANDEKITDPTITRQIKTK